VVASERLRPDIAAQRAHWFERFERTDPAHLVFLDETWTKTNLTRTCGWGPRTERVVEFVPHGHWKTTTFLAAIRYDGVTAPLVVDGTINGKLFLIWVREHLTPTLHPGDVVVMDNLAVHKVSGVREALHKVGAELVYLPPYSPDFNPIEQVFAWFKARLRALKARTQERLWAAIGSLCAELPAQDIQNYFAHSGYTRKLSA
jgi:putative transposase